ncbi:enoyl-ACP reductase FabI [Rhodothalassium salexigens]|uniref:enoyl-ACP reductase FabI n=1 Tax=Rhodothalassium salexigens TaxID=1086 RepID=UPI001911E68E|nr:enoyl-ACP reductase FabI [Rhodothalassium salexigens]
MTQMTDLAGKTGLILGIANADSIAYGCAKAFRAAGADLAITYLNAKAEPHVRPLAEALDSPLILPCDVTDDAQLQAVFDGIRARWGRLDFVLHSIAFAPKGDLHGRLVDTSRPGFLKAMDISCHSFIRCARLAEPLMDRGGALMTVTFYGSARVVDGYSVMGPVKAALEASVRYLADDLAPRRIRVHAISPGPIRTRAASGIRAFDRLIEDSVADTPDHRLVTIDEVGDLAAFLASPAARGMTGTTEYVDAGLHLTD